MGEAASNRRLSNSSTRKDRDRGQMPAIRRTRVADERIRGEIGLNRSKSMRAMRLSIFKALIRLGN